MACRMFDEEYVEWENATTKCQELGARLPVLSDAETIKIVKKYLETAEFEVFEVRKLKKEHEANVSPLRNRRHDCQASGPSSRGGWFGM